jgi:PAS domain S-box-containing protein
MIRILIVEDESIVAEDIQRSLENMGYSILSIVSSGEEAIEKVKENEPDLVLMDIMLDGEMDGIEAADMIHSFSNIPIIFLTAYSDEKILERAKITEPFGYIIKPFRERELHINIEIALYKSEMEKRLKDSQHWLASTLQSIGDAVIATDIKGIIKLINPLAQALTGWKQEDALGKHISKVFNIFSESKETKIKDPVAKVIEEGIFYGLAENTILVSKSGTRIPVDIIGSPIKDDRNDVIGVVLTFYDIIQRKKIENSLRSV